MTPVPQATNGITYAEKIDKAEARLDFSRPAKELDAHIRGLSPFPGAWFEANGKRIKVLAAKAVEQQGTVAQLADKGAIVFAGRCVAACARATGGQGGNERR